MYRTRKHAFGTTGAVIIHKDFRKIRSITRAKLHTYLLQGGVYVAIYSNRYLLYRVLYNALIEEEPYKWIDKKIIGALKEVSPIITVAL